MGLVFLCRIKCSVALPYGAMGCLALCDYGISWSYSLTKIRCTNEILKGQQNFAVEDSFKLHYAAFHLDLHCLQKYPLRGFPNTKG